MDEIFSSAEEPMMNILTSCLHDTWKVLIFPRAMHRPWQYAAKGEQNFLISPASVDMGGVLITPLEKDFEKIVQTDVESIFEQVLLSDKEFDELVDCIEK